MKLKVCGMTQIEQVKSLAAMGADYAGFIFYPGSPRFVEGKIFPGVLKSLQGLKKTGVFVNENIDRVVALAKEYGLDAIQLHGDEDDTYIDSLGGEFEIIKVLKMGDESITSIQKRLDSLAGKTTCYLLETMSAGHGGSGKKFDWSIIEKLRFPKPFFLSGGIDASDAAGLKAMARAQSMFFGTDINSRFETAPGIKNMELIKKFKHEIT